MISSILKSDMNLLITICARGGSKGIPGKNIRMIAGKPLIGYSIEVAREFSSRYNADITLSTDDETIKAVANTFGLSTSYQRPEDLASETAGKIATIAHLLEFEERTHNKQYDFVLDLDVTSPLRTITDLVEAFELIQKDNDALNLFSVNYANRNPYFNMVELKDKGYFGLVKKGDFSTRQSAPPVFDMNASFYFYRRFFFDQKLTSSITDKSLIYIMPHVCFDLDHETDFEFMEYLLVNDKLGFEL